MERILHVIGKMDRAGAETLIMNLYRVIDREKYQFDFLVHTEEEGDYDKEILSLGGRIFSLPSFNGLNYFAYKKACRNFFKKHPEYKVVHGHIGSTSAIYLGEAKKQGRFTIAHSHGLNYSSGISKIAFSFLTRPTRDIADFFIGCSREAGIDRFGKKIINSNYYQTLNNGIEVSKYVFNREKHEQKRAELGIDSCQIVFCHTGRFTEVKNHAFLIDVFSVINKLNPNVTLLLMGRGELEDSIKEKVSGLGLDESVKFLGLRPDVPEILIASDCFIFTSLSEGLPLAVVEAQAAGLPCIVSDGLPDLAIISSLAERIPLSAGKTVWAEHALDSVRKRREVDRAQIANQIVEAGFDVKESALKLCSLYDLKWDAYQG